MTRRVIMLLLMFVVACVMLYVSRFWFVELWSRPGLFGLRDLRPQGDLLSRWLRGTSFAPFELLIWACGAFLILTWLQKIVDFFNPTDPEAGESDEH
ncbi:MAG: hypothetical protein AAGA12_03550 [Pseudomonadota bacterium]